MLNPEDLLDYEFIDTKTAYEAALADMAKHLILQLDCETCGRDQIPLFLDQMEYQAQLDNIIMTAGGAEAILLDIDQVDATKKRLKDLEEYTKERLAPEVKFVLENLTPDVRFEISQRRKAVRIVEDIHAYLKDYKKLVRKISALQTKIDADKSGLIFHRCILALVQVGIIEGKQYLFDPAVLDERFNEVLRTRRAIVGMNLKFDMSVLAFHLKLSFDDVETVMYDVMLADKGLNSGKVRSFKLKDIVLRWLNYEQSKEEQLSYWLARPLAPEQLKYAAMDVITPGLVFRQLKKEIQITGDHLVEWTKLQMDFLKVLTKMELTGLNVNIENTEKLVQELNPVIEQLRNDIANGFWETDEDPFSEPVWIDGLGDEIVFDKEKQGMVMKETKDLASHKETLIKIKAYGAKHDIPALTYTTSTGKDAFEEIEERIPLVNKITEFRSLVKTQKDFCGAILDFHVDGRIHSNFTQIGMEGTRMSSKQPNVQNISKAGSVEENETYEEAYMRWKPSERLRTLFDAPEGYYMYDCDYSQIELYMIAYYSQDKNMLQAILDGVDLHIQAANTLFDVGWSYEDLKDKLKIKTFKKLFKRDREIAKTFNFAVVYGAGAKKLIKQLYKAGIYDMFEDMVNDIRKLWYRMYAGVKNWQDRTLSVANHQGVCTTRMGRNIYFEDRSSVYSKAFNAPIQASCYEGLQRAAVIFDRKVRDLEVRGIIKPKDIQLANLVHDEFIVYAKKNINQSSVNKLIQDSMIEGMQPLMEDEYNDTGELVFARVPVRADSSVITRWSDK